MKKTVSVLVTAVLSVGMILANLAPAFAGGQDPDTETSNLVVVYSDKGNDASQLDIDEDKVGHVTNLENGIDVIEMEGADKEEVLEAIKGNDNVEHAFFDDFSISTMGTVLPNDPGLSNADHYYRSIQADETWNVPGEKGTVVAAVIDTGVERSCLDLAGKVIEYKDMYAASKGEEPCAAGDISGHGTEAANIIAAIADNNIGTAGIAGTADVKILSYRCGGTASAKEAIDAVAFLQALKDINDDHPEVRVVNMSFGFLNTTQSTQNFIDAIQEEIDRMTANGVIVCAASGNSGISEKYYPACCDHVCSVGAVDENSKRASFSTYNEDVDLAAPGKSIPTVGLGNTLIYPDGTSFAAPIVSGAFAYLLSVSGAASSEIEQAMTENAKDLGTPGKDDEYGSGLIRLADTYKALKTDPSITLDPEETDMLIGEKKQLKYTVSPEDTQVTWKSSNEAAAAVDDKGNVTAVSVGTAEITAVTEEGRTAVCKVTVYDLTIPADPDTDPIAGYTGSSVPNTGLTGDTTMIHIICAAAASAVVSSIVLLIRKRRRSGEK